MIKNNIGCIKLFAFSKSFLKTRLKYLNNSANGFKRNQHKGLMALNSETDYESKNL